jgi:predicted nuclease of predicted toxin-antitoxin system
MDFHADENIPGPAVLLLRQRGHDVVWSVEVGRGLNDPSVLAAAIAAKRILLTFDKDFGELVFRHKTQAVHGIVLFRFHGRGLNATVAEMVSALTTHADELAGNFVVVSNDRVRVIPLGSVADR